MSIGTYAELQTAVAAWMHRSDLTAIIPDFIALAEESMNDALNARSMDTSSTLVTVAGTATVALPTDLVVMRRLQIVDDYNTVLNYRTPDQIAADYNANAQSRPESYTVIGDNIELAPIPDAVYSLSCTYKQRIPALTDINTTNWLLTSTPSAYLYGALCAAQPYIMNDVRMAMFRRLYQDAIDGINKTDWYSGTSPRVRAR